MSTGVTVSKSTVVGLVAVALVAVLAVFLPTLVLLALLAAPCVALVLANQRLDFLTPSYLFATVYGLFLFAGGAWYSLSGDPEVFFAIVLGFAGFVAGVYAVDEVTDFSADAELRRFLNRPWERNWAEPGPRLAFAGLVTVTLVGSALYYFTYGVPIIGGNGEASRLSSISGQDYYIHFVMVPLPFLATVAWLKARLSDNRLHLAGAAVVLGITAVAMALTGFRALVGHLLILLLFTDQFLTRRVNFRAIGGAAVLFLSLFLAVTVVRYQSVDGTPVAIAVKYIRHRIFLVNNENLNFILGYFPAEHGYLLGRGYLMDLESMLPGADKAFSGWITTKKLPWLDKPVGITPTLVGESYANFGYAGVLVVPFLVGAAVRTTFVGLVRSRKRVGTVAFVAMVALFLAKAALRGIGPTLFVKILPLALIYVVLEASAALRPIRYLRNNFHDSTR
ncbi:O-antigen polymerase [Halomicrococcus sp. NG-SE-24]|uniref:O-antigen polymerase n=1 Tax=Halomicrococcus sp. NG-SE-24 TaxID=3436928 RepID=UPI003D9841AF